MRVSRIEIENFKSFLEPQVLSLESGFNIILGVNNSGKTSVLDVLDFELGLNDPHRSIKSLPVYGVGSNGFSRFEVSVASTVTELQALASDERIWLPVVDKDGVGQAFSSELKAEVALQIDLAFEGGRGELRFGSIGCVSGVVRNWDHEAGLFSSVRGVRRPFVETAIGAFGPQIVQDTTAAIKRRVYRFSAQRRPQAFGSAASPVLDREATQLPYCLNHLQAKDPYGHGLLCSWINRIFPSVKWVSSIPENNGFRIYCSPELPNARRDDLVTPMERMGSGLGNVIAMLYVVLTSRQSQVIAIDEPNAFLHPRALRELLSIMESEGGMHQFILTAHSSDVLTAIKPSTICLLEFQSGTTRVSEIGAAGIHKLRSGLAELGIRITDLHAKDRVLWVEGQTEEAILPDVLRWACPELAAGTAILRVERTGTFSKKGVDPKEVVALYVRLSESTAFAPPMVCIILDGETRSEAERQRLLEESNGRLRFLDRRMLENYILHPFAIARVLQGFGETVGAREVETSLSRALGMTNLSDDLANVDGAAALKAVFAELTESRIEFRKTRDVPAIVDVLLTTDPDYLLPLGAYLRGVLQDQILS